MWKFFRIVWGGIILMLGDCPYCYGEPKDRYSCPVCLGENLKDKAAREDRKWRGRLWRKFRAFIDCDYS